MQWFIGGSGESSLDHAVSVSLSTGATCCFFDQAQSGLSVACNGASLIGYRYGCHLRDASTPCSSGVVETPCSPNLHTIHVNTTKTLFYQIALATFLIHDYLGL